jgi:hypothetical protein
MYVPYLSEVRVSPLYERPGQYLSLEVCETILEHLNANERKILRDESSPPFLDL